MATAPATYSPDSRRSPPRWASPSTPTPPAGTTARPATTGDQYVLSVYGADHLGIVWSVAERLAALRINITDVSTRLVPGTPPLYVMLLEVTAPPDLPEAQLQQEMATLAAQVRCDITAKPLDVMRL